MINPSLDIMSNVTCGILDNVHYACQRVDPPMDLGLAVSSDHKYSMLTTAKASVCHIYIYTIHL